MCGHVGLAGKLELKDEATFKKLLIFDYFRGPDSTGMCSYRNNGDVIITKIASHPIDLFDSKRFNDALSGYNSQVFLGHNRFATKGKVNGANAHPYHVDHIVGAHNGTLDASSWTALEAKLGEKFEVDSLALITAIAKFGIEETVPMLQGAWALVWIDTKEGTLNFLRNKERPFWYTYTEDFHKVIWASEHHMMKAALGMSTVEYKLHIDQKGFSYYSTVENWWYKFDLEEMQKKDAPQPKPRVKELKGKEAAVVTYTYNQQAPFHGKVDGWKDKGNGVWERDRSNPPLLTDGKTTTHGSGGGSDKVVTLAVETKPCTKEKPYGNDLTKFEFDSMAKYGCSYCGGDVDYEDEGVVVYVPLHSVLCNECSGAQVNKLYN